MDVNSEKFHRISNPSDAEKLKQMASKEGFGYHLGSGNAEVQYLKSIGYEGIRRGKEYIIFDPSKWMESPINALIK